MTDPSQKEPLLERDSELTELESLVDQATAGLGRFALVEGPPGIGKTRLLDAVRMLAREREMAVLSARASELEQEFPLGVVRQLFEPLLASADPARRDRLLAGAASPAVELLADAPPPPSEAERGDDLSLGRFHALYWLTANLADERPTLLVVDDVHWADASSLRFLRFLLPRIEELPILTVLATRPEDSDVDREAVAALAVDSLTRVIRPGPLSGMAVGQVIARSLGSTGDATFAEACLKATGGNPFLLRELLRELASDGVEPSADNAGVVGDLAPPTVSRAVLLRLARLGEEAVGLARAVAVLGDHAPLHRASALAELAPERGAELADELARADILAAARPLGFVHPILRSAVYADTDPAERDQAHRRAAALLADEGAPLDAVAMQLLPTEPTAQPSVASTLRKAARSALARGAAHTAVACLRRAAEEPPPPVDQGDVLLELASSELKAGDAAAAVAHFDEGMRLTSDPRSRASRAGEQALALQSVARHDDAFAVRERAAADVAEVDPALARSLEATLAGTARWDIARIDWARRRFERWREGPQPSHSSDWRMMAGVAHLDAFAAGRGDSAAELADRAESALEAIARHELRRGLVSTGYFAATEVLVLADRVDEARGALDDAVDAARRRGSTPGLAFASGWRCLLLARLGELVDAEDDARSCVDLSLAQGWFSVAPMLLGFVLEVLAERGQLDYAEQLLDQSGMGYRAADRDLSFDPVVHARARVHAARGRLDEARADLRSLARRGARWNTYPSLVPAVLIAPELIADDPARARADAGRLTAEARAWGTPRAVGMATRALGLLEPGDDGIELLREAGELLGRVPARVERARALLDLGAALRRANRRVQARDPLREALDLAEASGAAPLAQLARGELRRAGGRPRRARTFGVGALTASERRVAGMAADGLSNPEIAQALFVTRKTVETHLGNAYRKLDIQSRAELPRALEAGYPT